MSARLNIVLVHGAWADGSSRAAVIERLQADGYHVTAPQFPESSLAADVARLRQVLALPGRPDHHRRPRVIVVSSSGLSGLARRGHAAAGAGRAGGSRRFTRWCRCANGRRRRCAPACRRMMWRAHVISDELILGTPRLKLLF